jgi:hypothetical protein
MPPDSPAIGEAMDEDDERFIGGGEARTFGFFGTDVVELEAVLEGEEAVGEAYPRLGQVPESVLGCLSRGAGYIISKMFNP